jgi:hypothetical protein
MVEPNIDCEHTTWSPAFSRPMTSSRMAAMPLAVADGGLGAFQRRQARSRLVTVGLGAAVGVALFLVGEARAAVAASGCTKPLVRYSASEFSP